MIVSIDHFIYKYIQCEIMHEKYFLTLDSIESSSVNKFGYMTNGFFSILEVSLNELNNNDC